MPEARGKLKMCVINPVLIDGLAKMVGSQVEVMTRLGISWNTWTKIRSSRPIRESLGVRLRSRVVRDQTAREIIRRHGAVSGLGKLDAEQLERIFLLPHGHPQPASVPDFERPAVRAERP